jgi:hypothetical protein
MEKRLNTKLESYVNAFKREIVDKIKQGITEEELITFVNEYQGIAFNEKDFLKRKRANNVVPICEKCIAKRMNGTQCTRRKQGGTDFCGTHSKGLPNGCMEPNETKTDLKQVEVFQHEINGIVYYIDNESKVYSVEDILSNKQNPKIIANYRVVDGVYMIV